MRLSKILSKTAKKNHPLQAKRTSNRPAKRMRRCPRLMSFRSKIVPPMFMKQRKIKSQMRILAISEEATTKHSKWARNLATWTTIIMRRRGRIWISRMIALFTPLSKWKRAIMAPLKTHRSSKMKTLTTKMSWNLLQRSNLTTASRISFQEQLVKITWLSRSIGSSTTRSKKESTTSLTEEP